MSELDQAVLRHVTQLPASPLVLIPTTSHTVDFAAAQLCSLSAIGWQPAALVVCWDRDACSLLRAARLPAVLDEVGGPTAAVLAERRGGKGKGKGTGGLHFEGQHKLGGKAHPYVPTEVFHSAGRALQWLKFYLLHRVTTALAGTRVPVLVVDADILWLRPGAAALSAACAEQELEPHTPSLQPCAPSLQPCALRLQPCVSRCAEEGLDVLAMVDGGRSGEYAASANAGAILSWQP